MCEESISGLQIDHVDISHLPLLNTGLENIGGSAFPPAVEAFRDRLRDADCFLFASPEYNYSISGGKRMVYHVRQVGVYLDIHFVNKPEGFVQAHYPTSKFDGNLIDPETEEQLRKILLSLKAFALRLIHGKSAADSAQGS